MHSEYNVYYKRYVI